MKRFIRFNGTQFIDIENVKTFGIITRERCPGAWRWSVFVSLEDVGPKITISQACIDYPTKQQAKERAEKDLYQLVVRPIRKLGGRISDGSRYGGLLMRLRVSVKAAIEWRSIMRRKVAPNQS